MCGNRVQGAQDLVRNRPTSAAISCRWLQLLRSLVDLCVADTASPHL